MNMSDLDRLPSSVKELRVRRALRMPRLRVDRYLLVWDVLPPHEAHRFQAVDAREAERVVRGWFRQGRARFWYQAQRLYCQVKNQPRHELAEFRKQHIQRWFFRQLDPRVAHLRLFKRKPPAFTGCFAEVVPEEHVDDGRAQETTFIEIMLIDEDENPVPNQKYEMACSNGEVFSGRLDRHGVARRDKIPPGSCEVRYPGLDTSPWEPV